MRRLDTIISAVMLILLGGMVVLAAGYTPQARLVPLVVGIPAAVLAAWQLTRAAAARESPAEETAPQGERAPGTAAEIAAVVWLVVVALVVAAGGLVIGGTLAVVACQRYWLGESWRTAGTGGAVTLAVLYVCFERLLGQTLFDGWLAGWL